MERESAKKLSEHIIYSAKELNTQVHELRQSLAQNEFEIYMKKISHIMALYFDILDLIGSEYPEYNPYEKN